MVCYQHSAQKAGSLMVWGCISAYGAGTSGKTLSTLKGN